MNTETALFMQHVAQPLQERVAGHRGFEAVVQYPPESTWASCLDRDSQGRPCRPRTASMPCPHTTRDTVPHLVTSIRVYQEYLTHSDAHEQEEGGGGSCSQNLKGWRHQNQQRNL